MAMRNPLTLLGIIAAGMISASPALSQSNPVPGDAVSHHGRMFRDADANGDGSLDKGEFDAMRNARFTAMDADGDGIVSAVELKNLHDKWHRSHSDDASRHGWQGKIFSRADTSGDGRITADEWQALSLQRFVRADSNGDGAITPDELTAVHGKKGRGMGPGAMHGRMDSDGDGAISKSEWDTAGAEMFRRLDRNADGRIEPAEHHRHMQDAQPQP